MQDTLIWTNIIAPVDNLGELLKEKFFVEIYDQNLKEKLLSLVSLV